MPDTTVRQDTGAGSGMLSAMWRHRLLVVAVLMVAVAAGLGVTMLQPESYAATARVFMADPRAEGVFRSDPAGDDARRQQNRVEQFRSEAVLTRAAEMIGSSMQLGELRDAVDATPATVADEIRVTAEAPDPVLARDLANAVVAAYREQFRAGAVAEAERTVEVLDQQLATVQEQLEEIEVELAPYLPSPDEEEVVEPDDSLPASYLTMLNVRRDANVSVIRDMLVARQQALIEARAVEDVASVEEAVTPPTPTYDPMLVLSLSVVLGLAAGALLAVWREERLRARATQEESETRAHRIERRPVMAPPQPPRR